MLLLLVHCVVSSVRSLFVWLLCPFWLWVDDAFSISLFENPEECGISNLSVLLSLASYPFPRMRSSYLFVCLFMLMQDAVIVEYFFFCPLVLQSEIRVSHLLVILFMFYRCFGQCFIGCWLTNWTPEALGPTVFRCSVSPTSPTSFL